MALETGTFINDLTVTNPVAADPKAQGDDHIRLLKSTLKNSLPGFTGVILGAGVEAQGSTVNDFTVTLSPSPAAYTANTVIVFKSTHANTSAATLQINALGTKALQTPEGSALVSGNLPSGMTCAAVYDGTAFRLVYASPLALTFPAVTDIQVFAASDTWTKPAGAKSVLVELLGAGGGGGSGALGAAGTHRGQGTGGGGGAMSFNTFAANDLTATVVVTIGGGGTAGAAKTVAGAGNAGGVGNTSTFAAYLSAFGGGGGAAGPVSGASVIYGGGGGGTGSAGSTGSTSVTLGGKPWLSSAGNGYHMTGGGGAGTTGAAAFCAEFGGSSGDGSNGTAGGSSLFGGAGGGAGSVMSTANANTDAKNGGTTNSYEVGGGGTFGASGAAGTVGSAGAAVSGRLAGSAGGGGGSGSSTTGAAGGAGSLGAGGGGGGGGTATSSGAGGVGGAGYCRVTTYF